MKFYDCAPAPTPRRVRVFLAEKKLSLPTVQVDLANGEQLGEPFRQLNPFGTVPVLELDDGATITEVLAICQYLEDVHPEPPLLGRAALERARVLMWNLRIEQHGLAAVAESFRNFSRGLANRALTGTLDFEQIPALVTRGRKRVEHFMGELDTHFQDSEYVVGDYYSIADISAMVAIDFAGRIKLPIPEEAAALRRWHASVSLRPSAGA